MKLKRISGIFLSISLAISIGFMVYLSKYKAITEYLNFGANVPVGDYLLGIDVSHHQSKIDWKAVDKVKHQNDSLSFVFIKATEGVEFIDARFEENYSGVMDTDMAFGFYHFFIPERSAEKQAYHFVNQIKEKKFSLRPVIDIEINPKIESKSMVDSVKRFIEIIGDQLDCSPLIYTYFFFYKDNFEYSQLKSELFWIARYQKHFLFSSFKNSAIWQFTDKGTVDGISTMVDLNAMKKSYLERVER